MGANQSTSNGNLPTNPQTKTTPTSIKEIMEQATVKYKQAQEAYNQAQQKAQELYTQGSGHPDVVQAQKKVQEIYDQSLQTAKEVSDKGLSHPVFVEAQKQVQAVSYKGLSNPVAQGSSVKPSRPDYATDEKYGDVTILEFISTVWSRLAYLNATDFLAAYKIIFKDEFVVTQFADNPSKNPLPYHTTIQEMMKAISEDSSYLNKFIPFLPLAQKINVTLGEDALVKKTGWLTNDRNEQATNCNPVLNIPEGDKENIIFTCISTSNYSGCYVFADTRMPNIVCVAFRGTYSIKSAGSYMQPKYYGLKTILPKENIKVMTGIHKIMIEMVHTILNAIEDIKAQLKAKTNSTQEIKLIVTGHSLGGGLATLFSYVYMKTTTIQKDNLSCISIGSPRVFNMAGAKDFCNMCTTQKLFEYKRLKTSNDPVTIMPFTAVTGATSLYTDSLDFQHPCSDESQVTVREETFKECLPQVSNSASTRCINKGRYAMTSNYDLPLTCTRKNKSMYSNSFYFKNPMAYHAMYLSILFAGAIDASTFFNSNTTPKDNVEINRFNNHKDTACKLSCYDGKYLKIVYFNLTFFRKQNGEFNEDVYVTKENYAMIKSKIKGSTDLKYMDGIVPEDNAIETHDPTKPFNSVESDEAGIELVSNSSSKPPDENVQFPKPDVTEKFLLEIVTDTKNPPVQDPSEVMSTEDIASIKTSTQPSSVENASKQENPSVLPVAPVAAAAGGGRTKRTKSKRKKTRKRKIKLYL
jgi:hypothetical protein